MKSGKLKKLGMPQKRNADLPMNLHDEEPSDEISSEPQDLTQHEEDMGVEVNDGGSAQPPSELEKASDEDLLAEMKKRGLMSDLEEPESEPSEKQPDFGM